MEIVLPKIAVRTTPQQTAYALEQTMKECSRGHVIFGSEREPVEFYAIEAFSPGEPERRFGIGVQSRGLARPNVFVWPDGGSIVVGYDDQVVSIDALRGTIEFEKELHWAFYSFLYVDGISAVVAIDELGATAFRRDGTELWKIGTCDVVTASRLESNWLCLELMEGKTFTVNAYDGIRV